MSPNFAFVKGMGRSTLSYLKTKIEGNYFLSSYFSLPFLFFPFIFLLDFFFFQSYPSFNLTPLLDFISLNKYLFLCVYVYKTDLDQ